MKSKFFLSILALLSIISSVDCAQTYFGPCLQCDSCSSCSGTCNTTNSPSGCSMACHNGNSPTGFFGCNCADGFGCATYNDCQDGCLEGCYCEHGHTWFSQKDQSANQYVIMSLTSDKRHHFGNEFYGDFALTLGYQKNFNNYRLSSYFFNKNGLMRVGGNAIDGRTAMVDVRASDLGLPATFTGTAWLCPKYQDFLVDLDLYMAWDNILEGLWSELRIPYTHTRWNAGLGTDVWYEGTETNYTVPDTVGTIRSGQTTNVVNDDSTIDNIIYQGKCALTSALLGNVGFGDAPRLDAGKIINANRSTSGLSGIHLSIGYDFLRKERGFLGIGADFEFPAANKPSRKTSCCDLYIFEPKIGDQNKWLIGGLFFGQYQLKNWAETNQRLDLVFDARAYVSFSGETTRLLGLVANGTTLFNHYLLLKKYSYSGNTATYAGLERAANSLKAYSTINPSCEGQFTAMLNYQKQNFEFGIGYNFFGRAKEEITKWNLCKNDDYHYVVKGDAPVANADATIDGGFFNANDSDINQTGTLVSGSQAAWNQIPSYIIRDNEIDFCMDNGNLRLDMAEHPQYISHTIFANAGYNWTEADWKPFIGLIGKVDFGMSNTALQLWGIYLKGGFCF